jgi:aminoglycoside phosphotransferase (APT) family kinase protein
MGGPAGTTTFSDESTRAVLAGACVAAGLDPAGAELLRLGENAIYRLTDAPVVVRIARAGHGEDAAKEVAVAGWLSESGVPAARLWPVEQPLDVDGHPVTFWHFIPGRRGGPGDIRALGRLLRRVHELPPPTNFTLPPQDPLQRVRPRIEAAEIAEADRSFLLALLDDLTEVIKTLNYPLPEAVNHGDAHVQNLMVTDDRVEFIDFEGFCWGHPEWDLAMTATEYVTAGFWTSEQYDEFAIVYGFDITKWKGFDVLRRAREIAMTTWIMQNIRASSRIHQEFLKRMESIRTNAHTRPWVAF